MTHARHRIMAGHKKNTQHTEGETFCNIQQRNVWQKRQSATRKASDNSWHADDKTNNRMLSKEKHTPTCKRQDKRLCTGADNACHWKGQQIQSMTWQTHKMKENKPTSITEIFLLLGPVCNSFWRAIGWRFSGGCANILLTNWRWSYCCRRMLFSRSWQLRQHHHSQ